jgi:hypothetical protein
MIQPEGMADDLGRSCGHRLNTRQMCQFISISSCTTKVGFPLRLAVKSAPKVEDAARTSDTVSRWEDWRCEGGRQECLPEKTKETRWMTVGRLATPRLPPRSV